MGTSNMQQSSKNILAVGVGLTIILLSNINGHYNPPFSISWTPVLLPLIIGLVNKPLYSSNFTFTVFYNFGLLLFNDLFIRSYAGGIHDDEGKAWMLVYFGAAFILSIFLMIIYAITSVEDTAERKGQETMINVLTVLLPAIFTGLLYVYVITSI